jgi:hypothetical protein
MSNRNKEYLEGLLLGNFQDEKEEGDNVANVDPKTQLNIQQ